MHRSTDRCRQAIALVLTVGGVLLVFLSMPVEAYLLALGLICASAGLAMLR